jgi:hypothetical protein
MRRRAARTELRPEGRMAYHPRHIIRDARRFRRDISHGLQKKAVGTSAARPAWKASQVCFGENSRRGDGG